MADRPLLLTRFACVDGAQLDTETAYRLIVGCVVPRPVAWITTVNAAGLVNVAPFSSYNYVATSPPMVAINIAGRAGDGAIKDGPDISEAEALGLALLPSRHVKPPRIASTPVQMECRLDQAIVLGRGINTLYIAEVVAFHLSDAIYDGKRVDSVAMRPIARLGGPYYASLGEIHLRPMLQRPPGGEGAADEPDPAPAPR